MEMIGYILLNLLLLVLKGAAVGAGVVAGGGLVIKRLLK
jgi:hypothetical protein